MNNRFLFNFKTDISKIAIPEKLNNPFGLDTPEIARIAAAEFQDFIPTVSDGWEYDFRIRKGKMFGILVVQKEDGTYAYLGTNSGRLSRGVACDRFVPSIFDDSTDDFFINKGMSAITVITNTINASTNETERGVLKEKRRLMSLAVQQQLFESYYFVNIHGVEKNLLEVFEDAAHGKPPAASGECAAPKLIQYAIQNSLRPLALAEFWWGNPLNSDEKAHKEFYPACKNKCRPILEYMLDDDGLYDQVNAV